MQQKHFIDSHKLLNALVILLIMFFYQAESNTTLWVYWALHGSYGVLWFLKSRIFPDKSWEKSCSLAYGLIIWIFLSLYWITPWLIASQKINVEPWYLAGCIFMFTLGVFLHFTADMQKHIQLKYNPGQLITGEMMARFRNANYLGELLIYLGFSLLAQHIIPILIVLFAVLSVWLPNMIKKDRSLSRYPDFLNYKKKSWLFLPGI